MYEISRTKDFDKSLKRIKRSGKLKEDTENDLLEVITFLSKGKRLPEKYRDHQLKGELQEYRECHIQGDLLLVYQLLKQDLILVLVDLGSHSYLRF